LLHRIQRLRPRDNPLVAGSSPARPTKAVMRGYF
jgi:hypothetical protein